MSNLRSAPLLASLVLCLAACSDAPTSADDPSVLDAAANTGDAAAALDEGRPDPAAPDVRPGVDAEREGDGPNGADARAPVADAGLDSDAAAVERPGCEPCAPAHAQVTARLNQIHFDLLMSRVEADRTRYVPLVWGSPEATGGDKAGLAGTLPAPGWLGLVGDGRVVVWAGHEGAWKSDGDGRDDNDAFRMRLLQWLLGAGTRVSLTSGHAEWLQVDAFSTALKGQLTDAGVIVTALDGPIDAESLAQTDVLVLGNPWGEVSDAELDAVSAWVDDGGAVLVLGLGWSWRGNNNDPQALRYPIQRLGERLGFDVRDGVINDPGALAGPPEMPAYSIRPLDQWNPREIVVLRAAETDVARVKPLADERPEATYVIEGSHMGLSLPTEDWSLLEDPAGALTALDRLYEAEVALAGGVNPPYGGDVVWIIPEVAPNAPWWMHSGNPIVFQAPAGREEIIARLNAEGHPGWGIAHEQGHNMHSSTCRDLYVADGMGEVWPNVFALWSYRENGWDWAPQMGAELFDAGHAYHAQASPDFADYLSDAFIGLGCLQLIWSQYGWDGMQRFMTGAATDAAAGQSGGDNAARVAYFVERLSAAYEVDLAPLIAHWGFPVSEASRAVTARWPESGIGW